MSSGPAALPPQEILAFASDLGVKNAIWIPLTGGRTNRTWHARSDHDDLVFKLFDDTRANPLFPNDPHHEAEALKCLAGRELAPELRHKAVVPEGLCLVYSYRPGRPLTQMNPAAIRLLAQVHKVEERPDLRRVSSQPNDLLSAGHAFLDKTATPLARHLEAMAPTPHQDTVAPAVFLHGDPVPSNFVASGDTLTLIDWQCPAYGDPVWDLALALSPAMHHVYGTPLTEAAAETALSAYPEPEVIARFQRLAPFFHWRTACYCAWKAGQGEEIYAEAAEVELSTRVP